MRYNTKICEGLLLISDRVQLKYSGLASTNIG